MQGYADLVELGYTPGNHAVVLGLLSALLDIPAFDAVVSELSAFATSWVAAAVRLRLIDHLTAQFVLRRVRSMLVEAAESAVVGHVDEVASHTVLPDLMSMRHERADLRLFSS